MSIKMLNKKVKINPSEKAKFWTVKGILNPLPETGGSSSCYKTRKTS